MGGYPPYTYNWVMVFPAAYAFGGADAFEKFAIDAATMRQMMTVHGNMPPEQFNAMLKQRVQQESQQYKTSPTLEHDMAALALEPTHIGRAPSGPVPPPRRPDVTFNREQIQNSSVPDLFHQMTGRQMRPPAPAPVTPPAAPMSPSLRPSAGPTAGTFAGPRPRR